MWIRFAFVFGGVIGMLGVILGAMGAHALKSHLSADLLNSFQVATRYQMFHAIFLILLGNILGQHSASFFLHAAIVLISSGIVLFSGSIYFLTLFRWKVGIVTPIGGALLILGWLCFVIFAWQAKIQ